MDVNRTVEVGRAALPDGLERDRTLRVFGAERRVEQRDLRRLVLIDVGDLRSHVAGIHQIRAIHGHGQPPVGLGSVGRILADRAHVALRDQTAPSALRETPIHSHPGHDLDQLGGIPALGGQLAHQGGVHGLPRFAGIDRRDGFGIVHDVNVSFGPRDLKEDARQRSALALIEHDVLQFPGQEARRRNRQRVGPGLNGGNIEESASVRDGFAVCSGDLVLQHDFGARNHRAALVENRGAQRSADVLAERGDGCDERDG